MIFIVKISLILLYVLKKVIELLYMIWINNDIDVDVLYEVFVYCMLCCSWIFLKIYDVLMLF